MSDNPLDSLSSFDRVSIRAVLVHEGEDPSAALSEAGILDPIAIPVIIGEDQDQSGGILGNGITPNLTAVLETEQDPTLHSSPYTQPTPYRRNSEATQPDEPGTTMLPSAFGMQPLAPVRGTRSAGGNSSNVVPANSVLPPSRSSDIFKPSQEEIERRYYNESFWGMPVSQNQHNAMGQAVAGFAGAGGVAGLVIGSMTEGAEVGSIGGPAGVAAGAAIGLVVGAGLGLIAGSFVGTQEDEAQGIPPLPPSARH